MVALSLLDKLKKTKDSLVKGLSLGDGIVEVDPVVVRTDVGHVYVAKSTVESMASNGRGKWGTSGLDLAPVRRGAGPGYAMLAVGTGAAPGERGERRRRAPEGELAPAPVAPVCGCLWWRWVSCGGWVAGFSVSQAYQRVEG
jgi:hypothetical protein